LKVSNFTILMKITSGNFTLLTSAILSAIIKLYLVSSTLYSTSE